MSSFKFYDFFGVQKLAKMTNSSVENYRVLYGSLISSYKFYLIMFKPFLKGVNDCVDDAHAGFFQNTNSTQRN